ncbi:MULTISPECIES: BTAD domain-containing putative transcriptional regulator [unclassified Aminobacter]|uniref:BTAD domain-containing putative transcriptional regulator n=1 Tax=unclassified Aminobacter TaxID=2644704 RepID=UPI0004661C98|nr:MULTISPECIES: BTAD domain-containing putative transcriptional regulator [unclassified Aminobacter]TWH23865.1 TolB-like protein [Aminobacter sp. J15]
MVASVVLRMETSLTDARSPAILKISMFGQLSVQRDGSVLSLPPSRKVRALMAYLALATRPVGRSRLCELLGDIPNDPKGELRWCLSKLRTILNEPDHPRLSARDDMVFLDTQHCDIDAVRIEKALSARIENVGREELQSLCELLQGDFLEGLTLNRSPQLDHWLEMQRRRYRGVMTALLEALTTKLLQEPAALRSYAEKWAEVSPFDLRAHALLLRALLQTGQPDQAERHLAATIRLFETEDIDPTPLRSTWAEMRKGPIITVRPSPIGRPAAPEHEQEITTLEGAPQRASLAVMPFTMSGEFVAQGNVAAGLTNDIISRLAKLRSLFLIARGSVFALAEKGVSPEEAARTLKVDYFVSGVLNSLPGRLLVTVELVETRTLRIVWAEEFDLKHDDAFLLLDQIGDMIVASIANEIETAEKNRAILKHPNSLNAWEAYHRGLWHMYRFTRDDNDLAQEFFRRSAAIDPTFARAHAGLSFTHWQNAFQRWKDPDQETGLALHTAARSLIVDDHDPAAHWAMGRALWLRNSQDQAVEELQRAVDLSPNFALGHYALSFVLSQSGDPGAAIVAADHSRSLSPFDPLLFGMLGTRAMAHVRMGQFEEAAEWAVKAAARPNAHIIILAIAAHCLALAGRIEEGRTFAATIRQSAPSFTVNDFLATFRFPPETEAQFRTAARYIGLD